MTQQETNPPTQRLETYAVLEIMGHQKFAGLVTEQTVAGHGFVRIDVPEIVLADGRVLPAFTKLFGPQSVYAMTPCTRETALAWGAQLRQRAFSEYEAPRLPAIDAPARPSITLDEDDSDSEEEDEEWMK